jgi:hypothetical protein
MRSGIFSAIIFAAFALFAPAGLAAAAPAVWPAAKAQNPVRPPCRDAGPRLADTGICTINFGAYINETGGAAPELPGNCDWTVNDALASDGKIALLYRAARCNRQVTKLEFRIAPQGASIVHASPVVFGEAAKGQTLVQLYPMPAGTDGKDMVLALARESTPDEEERAACEIRPVGLDGWPEDAFVVDVTLARKSKFRTAYSEVYNACGPLGIDTGTKSYWRFAQGYAWRYTLGQDEPDVDPRTFTIIRQDKAGAWATSN